MEAQVRGTGGGPTARRAPCGSSGPTRHPSGIVQPSPAWHRGPSRSLVVTSLQVTMPISVWRQLRARLCQAPVQGHRRAG